MVIIIMKICYLSGANSPHTIKWCKFFSDRGHEIHLISFDKGNIDNVIMHHIDLKVYSSSSRVKKIRYIFAFNRVRKLISEIHPDIIHAHRATGYAFLAGMSKFHPYILSVWGSDVYDLPKNVIYKKFVLYNLYRADYIFSTSKAMKTQVEKLLNKNKEIILTPFGVNINVFRPLNIVRNNNNNNKIIIGTIKTLSPKYGIDYLIRAFKIVKDSNIDIDLELQIAGKGEQEEKLKKLCSDLNLEQSVKFLGYLNQNEVVHTFNNFDIAVFPSTLDSESFGVAAVEAQACGVPVIVSNVGGLPEATAPNYSSILVEKKDADQLAREINRLVNNYDLRKEMSKNARKFVEKTYNINDNFGAVERVYKDIISKI